MSYIQGSITLYMVAPKQFTIFGLSFHWEQPRSTMKTYQDLHLGINHP